MHSQCPHCHSSFDIPDTAIEAAEGIVRCGNCMQLFDARAQSITAGSEDESEQEYGDWQEQDNSDNPAQPAKVAEHDDPESSTARENFRETEKSPQYQADDELELEDTHSFENATAYNNDYESTAEASSDDEEITEKEPQLSAVEDSESSASNAGDETSVAEHSATDSSTTLSDDIENDVIGLSVESEALFTPEIEMDSLTGELEKSEPNFAFKAAAADADVIGTDPEIPDETDSALTEIADNSSDEDERLSGIFASDDDAPGRATSFAVIPPLEHETLRSARNQRASLPMAVNALCAGLLLLLSGVLGLQWLSAYSDTSQWPAGAQPLLTRWCQFMYCNSSASGSSFESEDRVIHSHPEKPDALVLKATLINSASQPLPFPHLALEFSDLQDEPLARRVFKPEEYLSQSLLDSRQGLLPQNTPVKIEIEIADPGDRAVNYSLQYFIPTG